MRWFSTFAACLLALAVVAPLSSPAHAGKSIACKGKSLDGKANTWSCKSGEKCCYSALLNQGTCGKGPLCLPSM